MKDIMAKHGVKFYIDSPTNQQFVVLDNSVLEKLKQKLRFEIWEKADEKHTVVRFATSWATTDEDLIVLDEALSACL